MHKGRCLCGSVSFEVSGDLPAGWACHCDQCRRWSSHFLATTSPQLKDLKIHGEKNLKWYQSSEKARRGFCKNCGSPLFFDPADKDKHQWIGISLGAFDKPTKVKLSQHIYVAEKGDYYEITDGIPQNDY